MSAPDEPITSSRLGVWIKTVLTIAFVTVGIVYVATRISEFQALSWPSAKAVVIDTVSINAAVRIVRWFAQEAERVYALDVPSDHTGSITLSSPCSELSLVMARWEDQAVCPAQDDHAILECEGKPASRACCVRCS